MGGDNKYNVLKTLKYLDNTRYYIIMYYVSYFVKNESFTAKKHFYLVEGPF